MGAKKLTGTREWSTSSVNVQTGCDHGCLYCYAHAQAVRFGRCAPGEAWRIEEPHADALTRAFGKRKGRVMFPTTHDIGSANLELCAHTVDRLCAAGNQVLVVSKPKPERIAYLLGRWCRWKDQITLRFTIGSLRDPLLAFWEPYAPGIRSRLLALDLAFENGWNTSVSIEPMLDEETADVVALVERVEPMVTDTIWIGMMNHAASRVAMNGHGQPPELDRLMTREKVEQLYRLLARHLKVRWKDSIKTLLDLPEDSL